MEEEYNQNYINIKKRTAYIMKFEKKELDTFEIEKIQLFDDMEDEYPELEEYTIEVYSPREYYYNGILNSGALNSEEAWEFYYNISKQQIYSKYYKPDNEIINKKNNFILLYNKIIAYYKQNNIL